MSCLGCNLAEVPWICEHWKSNSFVDRFRTLALVVLVYFICRTRDLGLVQNGADSTVTMVNQIVETIWLIGVSWRVCLML